MQAFLIFCLVLGFSGSAQSQSYQNPVLNRIFPDPAGLCAPDGWFYAYGTNSFVADTLCHIQVIRSRDLVHWHHLGDALPEKPVWATQDFWAPHVIYDSVKTQYFLYFSADSKQSPGDKYIGVAVAAQPQGPFKDLGVPLIRGKSFATIDPMAFDDPVSGKKMLYWGSAFQPIQVQELDSTRTAFVSASQPRAVLAPGRDRDYDALIEGAWVIYRQGYYYLFYSGNNCCGTEAHYAVMVARATSPFGPFQTMSQALHQASSVILAQNDVWRAPGHNSVVSDADGVDWILYHAIPVQTPLRLLPWGPEDHRVLMLDRIIWHNNWPIIENGQPSIQEKIAPIRNYSFKSSYHDNF